MRYEVNTSELRALIPQLHAGDELLLTGTIYTARDAAHKRLMKALQDNTMPFCPKDAVIYYAGPTPARPGAVIGSCGPTTSGRMDPYTPTLLDAGVVALIGKGKRSPEVCEALCRNGAAYFCAIGGAGAYLSQCVKELEVIAYEDLGCESVKRLRIENFPVTVTIDCHGGNLYERKA